MRKSTKSADSSDWVRLTKYLSDTGESRSTFLKLRTEGRLAEGVHYTNDPLNRLWVNRRAMMAWVEGQVLSSRRG